MSATMLNSSIRFADSGRLLSRISHAVQRADRVTFLFGSALTAPGGRDESRGVPDTTALIEQVVQSFSGTSESESLNTLLRQADVSQRYQEAMQFVIDCRGQSALNELIESAVLRARLNRDADSIAPSRIEADLDGWYLRPAVDAVGKLVVENPESFSEPILTSNFDPLLEISIRKAGGTAASILLAADGQFTNVHMPGGVRVVHFHGYWHGSDTLHTPWQLTRNRPQLKGSLRTLLRDTTLIVMGYGGWHDVFTRTLVEVISEQTDQLSVLWTFYSGNEEDITSRNEHLLQQFEALAGQRVILYKGIDCHLFLPTLRERLLRPEQTSHSSSTGEPFETVLGNAVAGSGEIGFDYPPQAQVWVGREDELGAMLGAQKKIIAITGLGGYGKSTLAAKYLELRLGAKDVTLSYWADCREQGNTLLTQLVRLVEKLSGGSVTGNQIEDLRIESVLELLFAVLRNQRVILAFDNIDQYVDVEERRAVDAMDKLIQAGLTRPHNAQILLTGRPRLDYSHPAFLEVRLEGLTVSDTRRLFEISGVVFDPSIQAEAIAEVHRLTQGHPLALNLIATQVSKNKADLGELLAKLKSGIEKGLENPILPQIWETLNDRQQMVLRYLAEQTHPETEQRVASYLGSALNFNQFSRAVKALKTLSLIITKAPGGTAPDTIEVHPLIRDFVRFRFIKAERAPYINAIVGFCDRMIGKFRATLLSAPYSILENWIAKIELCINSDRHREALQSLVEVTPALLRAGYAEEFVRLSTTVLSSYNHGADQAMATAYDETMVELVKTLSEMNRFEDATKWLSQFEKTVVGKTARYIRLCSLHAYSEWLGEKFPSAIDWATKGVELKKSGNLDTGYDCAHNLALAQRDSGDIVPALKYFLGGTDLTVVTDPAEFDDKRGGAFYGNIGRCLQLQHEYAGAIVCFRKSALILEKENDRNIVMNRGWAAFWIGETLHSAGVQLDVAYAAFNRAAKQWRVASPSRAEKALAAAQNVMNAIPQVSDLPTTDWEYERAFNAWLKKRH